jgi:hypothetical protein
VVNGWGYTIEERKIAMGVMMWIEQGFFVCPRWAQCPDDCGLGYQYRHPFVLG